MYNGKSAIMAVFTGWDLTFSILGRSELWRYDAIDFQVLTSGQEVSGGTTQSISAKSLSLSNISFYIFFVKYKV